MTRHEVYKTTADMIRAAALWLAVVLIFVPCSHCPRKREKRKRKSDGHILLTRSSITN